MRESDEQGSFFEKRHFQLKSGESVRTAEKKTQTQHGKRGGGGGGIVKRYTEKITKFVMKVRKKALKKKVRVSSY